MRKHEIVIGREYAIKWDMQRKGELPMAVFRARLLGMVDFEVKAHDQNHYRAYKKMVHGYQVQVMEEPLRDPRWFSRGRGEDIFYGSFLNGTKQKLKVGAKINIESGRDFVAPWDQYATERHAIDSQAAEEEAAEWEAENRSAQIAERLRSLGFTVREHGDPWKRNQEGYAPEADYTIQDKRLTLDAISRLLDLAEGVAQ